ncbi:MurR/RpiR family transcriptional regulator [Vibrio sp. S4M6]|uniref:MurR/RpiR family transcriptional regulator n=1 Tax=Vibrio sinus TaxID=2946865 RepID=UPI00202A7D57|nr:MurR/RpiR family transcriptional regulator [Vibrio sinus]MCL9780742.1 MurR/RpiR family transcriptional regulator [Vibrio sinus]
MRAATSLNELKEQIQLSYGHLSNRLQQVAQYILENSSSVAFDTVASIAQQANVPPSTLIRFANAFGFSGFNEMKQLFRQKLVEDTASYTDRARLFKQLEGEQRPPETAKDILDQFARANAKALEHLSTTTESSELEKAAQVLRCADNIYVIGLRRSFSIASYFTYALRHLEKRAFLIDGLGGMFHEQLSMIGPSDVVVSISFSPYAEETLSLSEIASKAGAKQVVITDSEISPLATFSDACFVIKEAKVDAFRSQAASMCLVQSLAVSLAFEGSVS